MQDFEVIVVGGGHAGIEAASAAARMGLRTALITMDRKKIGLMSCNPAIGGLAKGQLVREIDALGGEMAKIIDRAGIHFKMLNKSKGPAVWSPRAQADRKYYATIAQRRLDFIENLSIIEGSVNGLIVRRGISRGVTLENGNSLHAKAVILAAGTFLNGVIHIGLSHFKSGRAGEKPSTGITEALLRFGFESGRLKTGTPPRILRESIDYSKFEEQIPDDPPEPFSFSTKKIERKQIPCFIGYTNEKTHVALREGFDQSPMFLGRIKSIGPRYCPSIEDKINRFADRTRHQLFLEPEGYDDSEVYVNGFSTSLPEHVQRNSISTIPGLEKVRIVRLGYAIEYDFFPPHQLHFSLETKKISGLYFAGQINGTSGYEEAAAQGLIAGINAVLKIRKQPPLILSRSDAYIGVLVDDLINKSTREPYRMFTSRAEFRLLLRQDNADLRLGNYGQQVGLLSNAEFLRLQEKREQVKKLETIVRQTKIEPQLFNKTFSKISTPIKQAERLSNLAKRPEIDLRDIIKHYKNASFMPGAVQEVGFNIKYDGYIKRNQSLIERFKQYEERQIPDQFNYKEINAFSTEGKEKLDQIRPANFGQASRISGVSPADLSVLLIYLEKERYRGGVPRETSS